eukprot:10554269-Karenia_brevis.AAC.1
METVDARYHACIPECQHGAVRKKGSDFATHVLLSAIDVAARWAWCIFILYVDLTKAFDRVVRELVMGMPRSCKMPLQEYLVTVGVPKQAAKWIDEYLRERGPLLKEWGVPEEVVNLICSLHDHCWFKYGNLQTVVVTNVGARQGCKSGTYVFNAGYSIVLGILHNGLRQAGICLRMKAPSQAFWVGAANEDESIDVIDVTFVDDEA